MKTLDLTTGSPLRRIVVFMLPLLIGNVFQQFYTIVDILVVRHTLGVEALSAVGAIGGTSFLIFSFAGGISAGATILTAQYAGAGEGEKVSRSIAAVFLLCGAVALLLTAGALSASDLLLRAMNTPADIYGRSAAYQNLLFGGLIATVFYNAMSGILRALGDSRTPLVFLIIASVLHVGLVYLFILGFHMDVEGAGLASVLSQLLSGIGCLFYALKKFPVMRLKKHHFRPDAPWLWAHGKLGLSAALQGSVTGVGVMVFQSTLNSLGTDTVAAFTASSRVESVVIMPTYAIGVALATYTAQNFGAGKADRVRKGVKICLVANLILSVAGSLAVVGLYRPLVEIFLGSDKPLALDIAGVYMRLVGSCYVVAGVLFIYRGAVQGLGNALMPMVCGVMELVMRIVSALFLAQTFGFVGLSCAYPLAWLGAAIPVMISYIRAARRNFGLPPEQPVQSEAVGLSAR